MTQETKDKISKANKGNKNPKPKNYTFIDRYGNDKAEIIKQKMSIKLGLSNNGRAKKVKDLVTGEIYGCAKEAALKYGINPWQLRTCLRGARKNKYNLVYIW